MAYYILSLNTYGSSNSLMDYLQFRFVENIYGSGTVSRAPEDDDLIYIGKIMKLEGINSSELESFESNT